MRPTAVHAAALLLAAGCLGAALGTGSHCDDATDHSKMVAAEDTAAECAARGKASSGGNACVLISSVCTETNVVATDGTTDIVKLWDNECTGGSETRLCQGAPYSDGPDCTTTMEECATRAEAAGFSFFSWRSEGRCYGETACSEATGNHYKGYQIQKTCTPHVALTGYTSSGTAAWTDGSSDGADGWVCPAHISRNPHAAPSLSMPWWVVADSRVSDLPRPQAR
jgi:hypothetical protein